MSSVKQYIETVSIPHLERPNNKSTVGSRKNLIVIKPEKLEVFRIAWKDSMSCYKKALKAARAEHLRKLVENNQNNPKFLFNTMARLTNKQT